MKKSEITVGGLYRAKISGKIVTVKVEAIREITSHYRGSGFGCFHGVLRNRTSMVYDVLNTTTGRRTTFRSAAKFRGPAGVSTPNLDRIRAFRNVIELHAQY